MILLSSVMSVALCVVFVSTEEEKIKNKLKKLQDKNPEKFYMEYVTPLDVDLTSLEHYGFRGVVPYFSEDKELAEHYLREAETMWDMEMGQEQSLSM